LTNCSDIRIEDLTIGGNDNGALNYIFTTGCTNIRISHCSFPHIFGSGITLQESRRVTIEHCNALSYTGTGFFADGSAQFITVNPGCSDILISDCHSRVVKGVNMATSQSLYHPTIANDIRDVTVKDCTFDGHFYTMPPVGTGAGSPVAGTATYSDGGLTKLTGPAIPGLVGSSYVRLLRKVRSATMVVSGSTITDSGASFLSNDLDAGDIVRAAGRFAILAGVVSNTVLQVEKWVDSVTYADLPSGVFSGTSIAIDVFKIYLGVVVSNTSTTITLSGAWAHQKIGTPVISGAALNAITDPLTFECVPVPTGFSGIQSDAGCKRVRYIDCKVSRSQADAFSAYGPNSIIRGCTAYHGQDTGFTVNGQFPGFTYALAAGLVADHGGACILDGNRALRMGIEACFVSASFGVISNNTFREYGWLYPLKGFPIGRGGAITSGSSIVFSNNICDGGLQYVAGRNVLGLAVGNTDFLQVAGNVFARNNAAINVGNNLDVNGTAITSEADPPNPNTVDPIFANNSCIDAEPFFANVSTGAWPGALVSVVAAYGTSPPTITITGTPAAGVYAKYRLETTGSGSQTTATARWSDDDGFSWHAITASASPQALSNGISVTFGAGAYVVMGAGGVSGHYYRWNITGTGRGPRFSRNRGYATEGKGSATIASGTTTATVTHGLAVTPDVKSIALSITAPAVNDHGFLWADSISSTQFVIHCKSDPGAGGLNVIWSYIQQGPS